MLMPDHEYHPLTVAAVVDETADTRSFVLEIPPALESTFEYVAGQFSVADAALFYVTFWAAGRMKMPLPKNVAAHYERMKNRPAVKRTVEQEGLSAAV